MNEIIHLNDDTALPRPASLIASKTRNQPQSGVVDAEGDEEWTQVKRRYKRKNTVVGNGEDSDIKGVPSYTQLHVYRLNKDTTMQSLTEFLKVTFPEVICEAMASKYPDLYSSFKVQIYSKNFKKAMDPKVWPSGACVNRFLELRKKLTATD
nr:unnamed protein product [Callosobruchus chinensis]